MESHAYSIPQHQSLIPKLLQSVDSQSKIKNQTGADTHGPDAIRNQRHDIMRMIEDRKRQRELQTSVEKQSPMKQEIKDQKSQRSSIIKGEYSQFIQAKKSILDQVDQEQHISSQEQVQNLIKSVGLHENSSQIQGESSLDFSPSPAQNFHQTPQPNYRQALETPQSFNQQTPSNVVYETQSPQSQIVSPTKLSVEPSNLASQTLSLFQPFASQDYQKKLSHMQETYSPPMNSINERGSKRVTHRINGQKIEDRLMDLGKQREVYIQKLSDYYTSKELQEMREKPEINPKSVLIAQKIIDSDDLYSREKDFLNNRELSRQRVASQILEKQDEELFLSPRINKSSQRLNRNVRDLHDWHQKSKKKQHEYKKQLQFDEQLELDTMRSASKTSKYNEKYLSNNKYYPVTTETSPDGKKVVFKVEDRLTNFGKQKESKLDSIRVQRNQSIKKRMASPIINKKSQQKKYSEKPFHERLYKSGEKVEFHCLDDSLKSPNKDLKSTIYTGLGSGLYSTMDVQPYEMQDVPLKDSLVYDQQQMIANHNHLPSGLVSYEEPAFSPQRKQKYTPLRQSRSPHTSASRSRSRRKNSGFGSKKPDYNKNYKQTFHKNVLLQEWQYLPLYDRQVLWAKQRETKTTNQRLDLEQEEMKHAPFKPQLTAKPAIYSPSKTFNSSQAKTQESYSYIHQGKVKSASKKAITNEKRDLYTSSPSQDLKIQRIPISTQSNKHAFNHFSPQQIRGMNPQIYAQFNISSPKRNLVHDFHNSLSHGQLQSLPQAIHHTSSQMTFHPHHMSSQSHRASTQQFNAKGIDSAMKLGDEYYMKMYQRAVSDGHLDKKKHQQKLDEIQKQQKAMMQAQSVEEELRRRKEEKKKMNEFMTQEKNLEINRDNQVLLNKLVEISAGKWSHIKKDKIAGAQKVGPQSLNVGYRKRETERIERENHAFAKRLFDKQANLSKKKLDDEYRNHLQYKKQIQKLKKKKGDKKESPGKNDMLIDTQKTRSKSVDQVAELQDAEHEQAEEQKPQQQVIAKQQDTNGAPQHSEIAQQDSKPAESQIQPKAEEQKQQQ